MKNSITPDELRLREEAFRSARGSIGLSGFELSQVGEVNMKRLINGDIDIDEYVNIIKNSYSDPEKQFDHLTPEQWRTLEADLTCARIFELHLYPV